MKNIVLSAVAVLAMSSFAVAGGDIAPVEEPMVVEPVITDSGFYLGLAYSYMTAESIDTEYYPNTTVVTTFLDDSVSSAMIQAGYKFNSYVAVEGRYWFGGTTDSVLVPGYNDVFAEADIDSWGIYVKPMYPVTDAFDIYALLGYASSTYDVIVTQGNVKATVNNDIDYDGFSWGLGASYAFTDNVAVFVDYVSLYDDKTDFADASGNQEDTLSTWNFGVTYQF